VGLHKNLWVSAPLYLVSAALPFGIRYFEVATVIALPVALCVVLIYLLAAAVFSHGKADIRDVSTSMVLWLYTLIGFSGLMIMHDFIRGGQYFYLLAFVGAWITDTFAYFTGMLLGKHKLIPDVSPKKTVEGAVGGVVFCTLSFVVFGLLYNRFWLADGDEAIPLLAMAIVGFVVSIVSQIGDLSLSLLKRKYGIKDFGKIFPGHGGVLDRFDSVLAVSIILTVSFVFLTALGI
jgi:phosphatidate cytidylyltransferase